MRFRSKFLGVAVAALSGLLASSVEAQALPDAVVSQSGSGMTVAYQGGAGQISINGLGPTAAPPDYIMQTSGSATVTYWIEVVGPANVEVPITFMASGATPNVTGVPGVLVTATLGSNTALYAYTLRRNDLPNSIGPPAASFGGSYVYQVMTNTPIPVQLAATWVSGGLGDGYYGGGTITGSVSASESIAASWSQLGYSVVSSAAAVSVPEPATYGLMLGGLILAFVASRRRPMNPFAR
jgi:hypothetical protein